ncbi:gamma-glutamyltranspeptidase [Cokeromyces recurvatus]|uniref:gamma-glutamyltranspeptidase n=1 Tax=Cokeromyces recurvatus TaxID=90255 RepID=UPI0022211439|nr:gamma-glutamyltranspeptidase [Cokeromyces recurvatus]KAI7906661.1 gamma-glutamyltranspeptidase [Cokeromyces recurvatus]
MNIIATKIRIEDDEEVDSQGLLLPNVAQPIKKRKSQRFLIIIITVFTIASIFVTLTLLQTDNSKEQQPHLIVGTKGAVAVETKECSDTGLQILKRGGSAVDAAIASALCIGVINSFATGNMHTKIGGFMLIRSPNGTFEYIDFRETAPAASYRDMFVKDPMAAQIGGLSVGVPGEIRGFELAHQRHGKIPWKDLFTAAIDIADKGFKVSDLLYSKLVKSKKWIEASPEFSRVFAPTGVIAQPGDIIKRPTLATTLRTIANEGSNAFYEGKIAASIVNATQALGGILTLEDMKSYQAKIRPTISTIYHSRKVVTTSGPTSGPALLSILNLIEPYYFNVTGPTPLTIHRFMEALKFGYAFRTEIADPDFVKNQVRLDEIISKAWADKTRENITDDATHEYSYYHPKYDHHDSHGTMQLSVIDEKNGAVALTSTVNLMFGAKFMDPVTGIILNDELDDFSIPGIPNSFGLYPSPYNYIEPYKRPLSTITPTIIEDTETNELLVVGGSGGSQIMTATLNVILNTFDFNKNLFEAVQHPRIHHQLLPNVVQYETGFENDILNELVKKGHAVNIYIYTYI